MPQFLVQRVFSQILNGQSATLYDPAYAKRSGASTASSTAATIWVQVASIPTEIPPSAATLPHHPGTSKSQTSPTFAVIQRRQDEFGDKREVNRGDVAQDREAGAYDGENVLWRHHRHRECDQEVRDLIALCYRALKAFQIFKILR